MVSPCWWKVAAAMISMAMFTRPAMPMAKVTSRHSKRKSRRSSAGWRVTIRPCMSAEWRKMTWGMTVAPRIPVASRTLSGPWNWGTTVW